MATKLRPVHPGKILLEEFLRPNAISMTHLSKAIRVDRRRIAGILAGDLPITADIGLRLSRYFGLSDLFWLNIQTEHDLRQARAGLMQVLPRIEPWTGPSVKKI